MPFRRRRGVALASRVRTRGGMSRGGFADPVRRHDAAHGFFEQALGIPDRDLDGQPLFFLAVAARAAGVRDTGGSLTRSRPSEVAP